MDGYTPRFTGIRSGYMGRLMEWPEVITEGKDIRECRDMPRDALREMVAACNELGRELPPPGNALIEQIFLDVPRF